MKIYIFLLTLTSSTWWVFGRVINSDFIDIGDNHERIRKVFCESSIVTVLLKSFKQPEGVIKWINGILGEGNVSFVVFNIANASFHDFFMDNCVNFQNDKTIRISYYERVLKNTYSRTFDGYESNLSLQATNKRAPGEKTIQEEFAKLLDDWSKFKIGGYIIFTSFEDLNTLMGCLCNRYGTFLFIIDEKVNDSNYLKIVDEIFHKTWKRLGSFKVFIFINQQILTFNPYKFYNNTFGDTRRFEDLYTDEHLKQINGYPLNVEIFWSAFSITPGNNFKDFNGPDIDVTRMIYERMNATCK